MSRLRLTPGHVTTQANIERLKVVGQKVSQLEARKRAALEAEDYDTAKARLRS